MNSKAAVAVCTVLALVPLWLFKYTPATDLPQHVALSAVGFRLLQGDALTQAVYSFNLQPIPYYMVYAMLIPAVGWLGPIAGAKVVLSLVALATVGAMALLCRTLGRPPVLAVGGLFIFYSAVFFWGFVTTLVGIPWVLLCVWALLEHARGQRAGFAWAAAGCAVAACCSHVILVPALFAAVAGYLAIAPKRHLPVACAVTAATLLPCVPWLADMLAHAGGEHRHIAWETPVQAWEHFRLFLGPFDHGPGRNAHHAVLLLVIAVAVAGRRLSERPEAVTNAGRSLLVFGGLNALLFLVVPLTIKSDRNYVWLVNMRYLVFAEAALFLSCKGVPRPLAGRLWPAGVVACFLTFWMGLTQFWSAYDRDMRPFDTILAHIPQDATLAVRNGYEHYARAWPFVTINMHAYALARGVRQESRMFEDSHMPVRMHAPPPAAPRPAHVHAFADYEAPHPAAMAPYDYALIEGSPALQGGIPEPQDGELVCAMGHWRLYKLKAPEQALLLVPAVESTRWTAARPRVVGRPH